MRLRRDWPRGLRRGSCLYNFSMTLRVSGFSKLIATALIATSILPAAAKADSLAPARGTCSVLYGAKHDFGIDTDSQHSGIYLDNNTCVPILLSVTNLTLTPNKVTLSGKNQLIKAHADVLANSPQIGMALIGVFIHDASSPKDQSNVNPGLCDVSLANSNPAAPAIDASGKGGWDLGINIPATCPAGNFHFMIDVEIDYPGATATEIFFELSALSGNKFSIVNGTPPPATGSSCKNLSQIVLSNTGNQVICSKINGKLVWSSIPGGKITGSATAPTSKAAPSISAGQTCPTAGKIQSSNGQTFVCGVSGKTKKWVLIGASSSNSAPSGSPSNAPIQQPSASDIAVQNGCSSFPSAMTNLYKHEAFGDPFRPSADIALQTALAYFYDAKRFDPAKYAMLGNAAFLIYQDVKASIFGGSGYIKASQYDLQQAVALFNGACKTSLYIP